MIIQQILLSLVVCKVVGDEFFGWMIVGCDLKVPSPLLWFLLSKVVIKLCVIILSQIWVFGYKCGWNLDVGCVSCLNIVRSVHYSVWTGTRLKTILDWTKSSDFSPIRSLVFGFVRSSVLYGLGGPNRCPNKINFFKI